MSKRLSMWLWLWLLLLFQLELLCLVKHFNKTCTPVKYDIVCQRTRNESTTNRVELFSTAILKFKHAKQAVKNNKKLLVFINFYYSFSERAYVRIPLYRFFFHLLLLNLDAVVFHFIILLLEHYQSPDPILCVQYYHATFVDWIPYLILLCHRAFVCVWHIKIENEKTDRERAKYWKMLIKIYHSFIHNVFVFDRFMCCWSKISTDNWKWMFRFFLSNYFSFVFLSSIVCSSISHSHGISTNFEHSEFNMRNNSNEWQFGNNIKIHRNSGSRVASLIEREKKSSAATNLPVDGSSKKSLLAFFQICYPYAGRNACPNHVWVT